jgi:hypothetical protein
VVLGDGSGGSIFISPLIREHCRRIHSAVDATNTQIVVPIHMTVNANHELRITR